MTINIIPCQLEQLTLLRDISIQTYRDTFSDSNSEALMQLYFSDALSPEKLLREFNCVGSLFYFIHYDGEIAGFLKVNFDDAQSDDVVPNSLEIERFYIDKRFLRKGLGRALMAFVFELAEQFNKTALWLGVWENNDRAKAFYRSQGFYQIGEHPFDMEGELQTDLLLKKDL